MLGDKDRWQEDLFVACPLRDLVLEDHILKRVDKILDLSWLADGRTRPRRTGGVLGAKTLGTVPTLRGLREGQSAKSGYRPVCAPPSPQGRFAWVSPRFSRQMLGQDKSAKARYDFSPYGELMRSAGLPLTLGYTGHRWDPAIGQYFAPFRYYNPQTARWNRRDPLRFGDGVNMYAYVSGNPITHSDRYGLQLGDFLTMCKDAIGSLFGGGGDNKEHPVKDQVDNATKTAGDAAQEILTHGTPGAPPGLGELAGAAQAAVGANELNMRVRDRNAYLNDLLNGGAGDPPAHGHGDLPKEKQPPKQTPAPAPAPPPLPAPQPLQMCPAGGEE